MTIRFTMRNKICIPLRLPSFPSPFSRLISFPFDNRRAGPAAESTSAGPVGHLGVRSRDELCRRYYFLARREEPVVIRGPVHQDAARARNRPVRVRCRAQTRFQTSPRFRRRARARTGFRKRSPFSSTSTRHAKSVDAATLRAPEFYSRVDERKERERDSSTARKINFVMHMHIRGIQKGHAKVLREFLMSVDLFLSNCAFHEKREQLVREINPAQ